jgi:hypothetical protein
MRRGWFLLALSVVAAVCGWHAGGMIIADLGANRQMGIPRGASAVWAIVLSSAIFLVAWLWLRSVHQICEEHYLSRHGPAALRCMNCGYDAADLPSDQCPECGDDWSKRPKWSMFPAPRTAAGVMWMCWTVAAGTAVAWRVLIM